MSFANWGVNRVEVLGRMSVFVVKMLTILGFVFYAGGPVDAVRLAFTDDPNVSDPAFSCTGCEKTAVLDISSATAAISLRPAVGGAFWDAASTEYNENGDADSAREKRAPMSAPQGIE